MSNAQNESLCASQIQQDYLLALSLSCRRSPRINGNKGPYEKSAMSGAVRETGPVKSVRREMMKKSPSGSSKFTAAGECTIQTEPRDNLKEKEGSQLEQTATTYTEGSKLTFVSDTTHELNPTAREKSHEAFQGPLSLVSAGNGSPISGQAHTLMTGKAPPSVPTQSLGSNPLTQVIPSHYKTVENIVATITHSYHTVLLVHDPQHRPHIPATSRAYAEMASKSDLLQDKFISMRTEGPSYRALGRALLPPPYPPCPLFFSRWMISRLFAFGHPTLVGALSSVTATHEVLAARNIYKNATGAGINIMPAYGSIRFSPSNVRNHVSVLFSKGPAIAKFVSLQHVMPTFAAMLEIIQEEKIPYYTKGTLLSWLLVCDFAESGLVEPPTARDLAIRLWIIMTEGKGGKGALHGLMKGLEGHEFSGVDEIEIFLERVYGEVKHYLNTRLQEQGGEHLFRPQGLWYSDIEHCLCKVVRSAKFN